MAKFTDIVQNRILPLKIEGISGLYVRDLPAKRFSELFDGFDGENVDDSDSQKMIENIFKEVVCGSDGTAFEEFIDGGFDVIISVVPIALLTEIIFEIKATLMPGTEALGN